MEPEIEIFFDINDSKYNKQYEGYTFVAIVYINLYKLIAYVRF